jgi:hypothetical protein
VLLQQLRVHLLVLLLLVLVQVLGMQQLLVLVHQLLVLVQQPLVVLLVLVQLLLLLDQLLLQLLLLRHDESFSKKQHPILSDKVSCRIRYP